MARIKNGWKGKGRRRYYKNAQKCYISHPCSEGSNDAIFSKFGTVVDLTHIMISANLVAIGRRVDTLRLYKIYIFSMTSMVGLTTGKHERAAVIVTHA